MEKEVQLMKNLLKHITAVMRCTYLISVNFSVFISFSIPSSSDFLNNNVISKYLISKTKERNIIIVPIWLDFPGRKISIESIAKNQIKNKFLKLG